MITHGELVCDSDAEYFERRHSLNARQTRRRVGRNGSSLTTTTEAIISLDLLPLNMLVLAQCCMWSSSEHRGRSLAAGMMTYVSSAYLHSSFPEVTALRSEALTTYDTEPIADPCTMLAEIWHNV